MRGATTATLKDNVPAAKRNTQGDAKGGKSESPDETENMEDETASGRSILRKEGSRAKAVYMEQVKKEWPGLAKEVKEICNNIGVNNITEHMVEKETIDEAIFYHNYKEMKIDMQKYEKLEDVKDDDFRELPSYFEGKCLEDVRTAFRI